jgi:glycosyltransferase involved in cell wall biosynthesis
MRIARVIARLNVGGPARHVSWLTAALPESILVTGRVAPGEDDMSAFAAALGVEPVVLGEMSRAVSWRDAIVVWRLFRIFRRFRPDIIHTHTAKAGTVGRVAGLLYRLTSRRKVRLVHTFHGHVFHGYYGRLTTALFLVIERVLARFTDAIVVLSPLQSDEIHGRYRIGRAEQFVVIPLGLDLAPYDAAPPPPPHDKFVVAIVGRLTEIKDHDFFLRLFAAWEKKDAIAHVIGDGHLRPALEQQARELGIADRVRFLGTRNDPEVFYREADLLVHTSRNEGTPLTILEAMAAGVPVLATAVGGVPDLLADCRGLTLPHGDVGAFGIVMSHLAEHPQLRASYAEAGREFVHRHYAKERLVRDIRGLYERLLNG